MWLSHQVSARSSIVGCTGNIAHSGLAILSGLGRAAINNPMTVRYLGIHLYKTLHYSQLNYYPP